MSSQWPAVGAETDPLRRARQLQRSWERVLADGALGPELPPEATAGLRATIVESWRRSLATGLDPTDLLAPIEADESEVLERWFEHPLGSLTHVLTEQLRKVAEESRGMVVVTDASGLVLHRVGDEGLKERAAEMNLVEGARYSEAADGTNGIGTALAADHAFQVFAFEHFNELHHQWICSGAPVHDPVSGQTIGLIDLSSLWKTAHPQGLELVTTVARSIEQSLLDARRDRDARLRRRYGDFLTRSTDLLVDHDGYVLDGAEPAPSPFDIPAGGGEVVLGDGSVALAAPLGRGEAYLLRRDTTHHAKSARPVKGLERAEEHARELAAEQAALRRVATLVARESSPDQLFATVAEQVARIFEVPHVRLTRFDPDGTVVVGSFSETVDEPFPIGSRWMLDNPGVTATVRQTGRPARIDDYAPLTGEVADVVRGAGMRSAVASPIVVEGRLWGAMVVLSPRHEPFPKGTEARLTDFSELVAAAIASAESREARAMLALEQAALRRVATLVAEGAPPAEIFAAVSNEVATLFRTGLVVVGTFDGDPAELLVVGLGGVADEPIVGSRWKLDDSLASTKVYRTGLPARLDHPHPEGDADPDVAAIVERIRPVATVAVPINVESRLWGVMVISTLSEPLPPEAEERLQRFTDLIATALASADARAEVHRLADEQAALRRVATLVAQQPSPSEVFTAVTQAVGVLLDADLAVLHVFPGDGTATTIASWSGDGPALPIGTRFPLDGDNLGARIYESGAPARMHSYDEAWERAATDRARSLRVRSAVGAPILVEGKLWGALMAATRGVEPWGQNAETRIAAFTELVATAIANAESREARALITAEQAALRRVATLVAGGAGPDQLFAAVADEAQELFGAEISAIVKFEDDETVVTVGARAGPNAPGTRAKLDPDFIVASVRETRRAARFDTDDPAAADMPVIVRETGARSAVASPIVVEGKPWGAIVVGSLTRSLPAETERRLADFTELVATAVANTQAREEVTTLADEQAALRRVATLVAQGATPEALFEAVAEEVGSLLPVVSATMGRYEPDDSVTTVASWSLTEAPFPTGGRWPTEGTNVAWLVLQTGRSARIDDFSAATDPIGVAAREAGYTSAVGSPIVVEGHVWGVMTATSAEGPMPAGAEARLEKFTELVATAIADAESRQALAELADEQAALRRVATLVAQGVKPSDLFTAVSEEVGRLFDANAAVVRFDSEGPAIVFVGVGGRFEGALAAIPIGTRWELDDSMATMEVYRTGRSGRVDAQSPSRISVDAATGELLGETSTVASPITVEGRLWGAVAVSKADRPGETTDERLPLGVEARLEKFTELVGTAIANAEGRSELAASRRRIVAASDEARRRFERDLHDSTQQRLVSLMILARSAEANVPPDMDDLRKELSRIAAGMTDAVEELQVISRGIHPAILSQGGLAPALRALARRSAAPVELDVATETRLSEPIEVAAYFVVSEALTNAAKYSQASHVDVSLVPCDGRLVVSIRDDGVGGATFGRGSGLLGLQDRVEALGGTITIESEPGNGTLLVATLPLDFEQTPPREPAEAVG